MDHKDGLWQHGIDEGQNDVIEKAQRQYEKNTGQHISKRALVKRIIMNFGQDMDIVSADMVHQERKAAWQKFLKRE